MKKIAFSALALGAALFALPASAQSQMPFPALMNALTGQSAQPQAAYRHREVPQPRFRTPGQDHRQAARVEPRWHRSPDQPYRAAPMVQAPEPRRSTTTYRREAAVHPSARAQAAVRPQIDERYLPTVVPYSGRHAPGTIVIDTNEKFLYLVEGDGTARRYGVGVGRPGFEWAGTHSVTRKAEWPGWTPPPEMRKRQPGLPKHMVGGPNNPLGARALYLGSTLYRIHGSNEPWTIGRAVSSGCIRMRNEDVIDLYNRVKVGTKVIVS
ncbi:L,D-transpeptidase [Lutibaculum baratangense]|uniref:L,D-TPase catalytic domain-containing protein n=1 Tax=Lutibaculum baratangense AMV1 TaxID=631454 RepID=V4R0I5_9HYPH|nr:L,D-transpeptidase [Lutibaculum baratangense]ESR25497.1 hypothetical protein N177_1609 [Lutibaculum baratangense AMV1]